MTVETWTRNDIQFPRLIEEAQAAGAFTAEVIDMMAESMDLTSHEVVELLDRAQAVWDRIKADTPDDIQPRY